MKEQLLAGRLVTIDGAGGVGKSTAGHATVDYLRKVGIPAYATRQPSDTVLGGYIRAHADTYSGISLACLVAGDRHHQQATEIGPALEAGKVVLCDRYLPSSLVLQVLDGVPAEKVWQLNDGVRVPDVAVFLRADPDVIASRLAARGAHDRFERDPDRSIAQQVELFNQVAYDLRARGWPVHVIDCTDLKPQQTAAFIAGLSVPLLHERTDEGTTA
ncbi:dTMP kinase [Nocardia asiatica]|uniref:dTMP kinase n=1 Tax=Nocardia asiatica TaxID=209252 RepID=UPI00245427C3|nr:dTMP kinase [Nocardia asiatica]